MARRAGEARARRAGAAGADAPEQQEALLLDRGVAGDEGGLPGSYAADVGGHPVGLPRAFSPFSLSPFSRLSVLFLLSLVPFKPVIIPPPARLASKRTAVFTRSGQDGKRAMVWCVGTVVFFLGFA